MKPKSRCSLFAILLAAVFAGAAPTAFAYGEADPTYNSGQFPAVNCQGQIVALTDGRVFATVFNNTSYWGVAKFRADGSVDADWGQSGATLIDPSRGYHVPRILLPTDNGLLLVADLIVRLTADGRVDTSYGDGGFSDYVSGVAQRSPTSAALTPDGGVVVFGYEEGDLRGRPYFTRFDRSGRRDPSFGTNGFVFFPIDPSAVIYAWSVTSTGGVEVAAYQTGADGMPVPAVSRSPGTFDTLPPEHQLVPRHGIASWLSPVAKVDARGRLLIADRASGPAFTVTRFAVDGSPDVDFGLGGQLKFRAADFDMGERGINEEYPKALLAAPGGGWTILVQAQFFAGFVGTFNAGTRAFRLHANGLLDLSFPQAVKLDAELSAPYAQRDDGRFMHPVTGNAGCGTARLLGDVPRAEATVVEYYNAATDRYFLTQEGPESAVVDATPTLGWMRTGRAFGAWQPVELPGAAPVCRFLGALPAGYSHFYTSQQTECDGLRALAAATPLDMPAWRYEGINFVVTDSPNGRCAPNLTPVYRAYNRGFARGIVPNHRYTTDRRIYQEMLGRDWGGEGVRFCAPPASSRVSTR